MMPGNAHIAMSGNKETDRPLNTLIDKGQPFPDSLLLHHGEH